MKHIIYLLFLLLSFQHNTFGQNCSLNSKVYAMEQANLARRYYNESKLDSAVMAARNALRFYPENPSADDIKRRTESYTYLSQLYMAQGQHSDAIETIRVLLDFASEHNDTKTVAKYEFYLGTIYYETAKYDEALLWMGKSVKSALAIKDYETSFLSQLIITNIHTNANKLVEALSSANLALEYAELSGNDNNYGGAFHLLGVVKYSMGEYRDAIKAYEKSMVFYDKSGDKVSYDIVKNSMIALLPKVGREKEALDSIRMSSATESIIYKFDSTSNPNTFDAVNMQRSLSDFNALDKTSKFELLHQDYLVRQAATLKLRIWFISIVSSLVIALLLLLYNRQRQKANAATIARYAQQKENEYLTLQKETEQRLIRNYIEGLECERERISKELHDGVCNDLLALEIELKEVGLDVAKIRLLTLAREGVRNISHELLPPQFQFASIDEMLSDFIGHLAHAENVSLQYRADEDYDWNSLSKDIAFVIYRIVQESLSNSMRHSGATNIEVTLSKSGEEVQVEITDNGIGFDKSNRTKGAGMNIINDRVKGNSGELFVNTGAEGTTIKAVFKI